MRMLLAGAAALAMLSPAQAADEYTVRMSIEEWGVVAQALGEIPYRAAAPVVDKLRAQIGAQQAAKKAAEPPKPAPEKPKE